MDSKKQDIILLLRDYMNFLPGGSQDAFVPTGSYGNEGSWPLTSESLKRMDKNSLTGQTYDMLDKALRLLQRKHPSLYTTLLDIYLREEAGHRDLDRIKTMAANGNPEAKQRVLLHEDAISKLAEYLKYVDLYVEYPRKATGPKPGMDIKAAHEELFAIFKRYSEEGQPYKQARDNAATKMVGPDGKEYYGRRHADRIIKGKLKEQDEEAV